MSKEKVVYPEDKLALKWDLCLSDTLLKTAVGTGLGVVFSLLAFNRRPWPVALGFGAGMGMAVSNCRHELAKQRYIASHDRNSPYYGFYEYDNRGRWWEFNRGTPKGTKFVEVVEEERYDPNYYKNIRSTTKDEIDRLAYKGERKVDDLGRDIKSAIRKGDRKLDELGNEIKSTIGNVEGSMKTAGKKLESGIKQVGHKIEGGLDKIEGGFKSVGEKIESGFKKAGSKIERGLKGAGEDIDDNLTYAGRKVNKGLRSAGDSLDSYIYDATHYRTPAENVEYAAYKTSKSFKEY